MIEFYVPGKPMPQGSMRIVRGHMIHAKGAELKAWRRKVAEAAQGAGVFPLPNPIGVDLQFAVERPRTVRRPAVTVPPDLDKLVRGVLDALTGVAYEDDAQVVALSASKAYGAAGVHVTIRYL